MNPTGKKILIVTAGVSAVGTALYFLYGDSPGKLGQFIREVKSKFKGDLMAYEAPPVPISEVVVNTPTDNSNTNTSSSYPCNSFINDKFPIAKGMKGSVSKKIQETLNIRYNENLAEDGCFGNLTEAAVVRAINKKVVSSDNYLVLLGKEKAVDAAFDLLDSSTWF